MRRGIRFRAYPNKQQKILIDKTFGCCRLVYNKGIEMRETAFNNGEKCNYVKTTKMIPELKKSEEYSYLKEVDNTAMIQSLRDLDVAYDRYFKKIGDKPKFKTKHNLHQRYRTVMNCNNIRIEGNHIRLPKINYLKIKQSREVGVIKNVTVEKTPSGKYFVIINEEFTPKKYRKRKTKVGIDVGIKNFLTDSNGNIVENPKYYEKYEKKIVREQKRLNKKEKGSKNREKQRIRLAKAHEKIYNSRKDFLHKLSSSYIRDNQTICVEDLRIKGMLKNSRLAKHINSVSWGKFFEMLEYKAEWYGRELIKIPTFFPSSQTCSACGYKNPDVKNLSVRKWTCPKCNTHHDRDHNASLNILAKGLNCTAGHTGTV